MSGAEKRFAHLAVELIRIILGNESFRIYFLYENLDDEGNFRSLELSNPANYPISNTKMWIRCNTFGVLDGNSHAESILDVNMINKIVHS